MTVRTAELPMEVAAKLLQMLNPEDIQVKPETSFGLELVSKKEPIDLLYPEGWYYAKGCFRNKHNTTNGIYEEAVMLKPNGDPWREDATYSTKQ